MEQQKIYKIGIDARMFSASQAVGIGHYTEELIRHILKHDTGNQYYVFLMPNSYNSFPIHAPNLTKVKVTEPHYSISEQLSYPKVIDSKNLDLIHYTNFNSPVFFGKTPSVVTIHDLTLWFFSGRSRKDWLNRFLYKQVIKRAAEKAERIIAISHNTKKDIVKLLGQSEDKIFVVHEAASKRHSKLTSPGRIEGIKAKFGITKPYMLYVGQWRAHKNIVRLIRAFHIAKRRYQLDSQLVLVGKIDKKAPEVLEVIKKLNLKSDVVLTGFVPDEELPYLYHGSEVFIFPSLYEGFGLPPLEAMASGTPVIASNSSAIPEILGKAAKYFDPRDVENIAKTMVEVMKNGALRKRLKTAGLKQVGKYSFDKMAKETIEIYKQILA
ncbi:MAG: glycosyltransferase family 1 protein [Patescibacteria group bacterium]|nr:glycosyltransferase family 1 protein [Patescibacteria group bacterium]